MLADLKSGDFRLDWYEDENWRGEYLYGMVKRILAEPVGDVVQPRFTVGRRLSIFSCDYKRYMSSDSSADTPCRKCPTCKLTKPLSDFPHIGKSYCFLCKSHYNKKDYRKRKAAKQALENEMTDAHTPSTDGGELPIPRNVRLRRERKIGRAKCVRKRKKMGPGTELYILRNTRIPGELKIGRTNNYRLRKHELQRSQNFSIEVLTVFPQMGHLERAVHAKLQHARVSGVPGRERFACNLDEAMAAVMAMRRADELGNTLSAFAFPG